MIRSRRKRRSVFSKPRDGNDGGVMFDSKKEKKKYELDEEVK